MEMEKGKETEMENMERKDMLNKMNILEDATQSMIDAARAMGIDQGKYYLASHVDLWLETGQMFDYVWTDQSTEQDSSSNVFYGAEVKIFEDRLVFDVYSVMYHEDGFYGIFYNASIEPVASSVTRFTLDLVDFVPRWSVCEFNGEIWNEETSFKGWEVFQMLLDLGLDSRRLNLDAGNKTAMESIIRGKEIQNKMKEAVSAGTLSNLSQEYQDQMRLAMDYSYCTEFGLNTLAAEIGKWMISRGMTIGKMIPIMEYLNHNFYGPSWEYQVRNLLRGSYNQLHELLELLRDSKGTKEVLNRNYDFNGEKFLTKTAFGGIGEIRDLDRLKVAIYMVRGLRGFKPHYFELIKPEMLNTDSSDIARYEDPIREIAEFFGHKDKTFKAIMDVLSSKTFGDEGGYHRFSAVINEINYNRDNPIMPQVVKAIRDKFHGEPDLRIILPFMEIEVGKLAYENLPIDWEWYDIVEGVEISDEIKVVTPYCTHDLIEWGAQQNNCIGTSSHIEPVLDGVEYIIGFQKPDGTWWGHAQIDVVIVDGVEYLHFGQLLGHSNSYLPDEVDNQIINFLKGIGVKTGS